MPEALVSWLLTAKCRLANWRKLDVCVHFLAIMMAMIYHMIKWQRRVRFISRHAVESLLLNLALGVQTGELHCANCFFFLTENSLKQTQKTACANERCYYSWWIPSLVFFDLHFGDFQCNIKLFCSAVFIPGIWDDLFNVRLAKQQKWIINFLNELFFSLSFWPARNWNSFY